jgi:predicted dinucleotide-binding enzyme
VTFARGDDVLCLLPDGAAGGSGWMVAIASDEREAHDVLVHDLQQSGFDEIDVEQLQPVKAEDIVDAHLVANLRALEPGTRTVWATLHAY